MQIYNFSQAQIFALKYLLFIVTLALLLAGCGDSSTSTESSLAGADNGGIDVNGSAVKGPLVGASVSAYLLDTLQSDLKGQRIALGSTDQQAQLDLRIPFEYQDQGPFLLEFTGGTEISGNTPEIAQLTTLLTNQQLNDGTPVYATPLSSFAIAHARQIADLTELPGSSLSLGLIGDGNGTVSAIEFMTALEASSNAIKLSLGLGLLNENIDLFTTSPLLGSTDNADNTLALRIANEVFAALITEIKQQAATHGMLLEGSATLQSLAEDFSDGTFDQHRGGLPLTELIDISDFIAILVQDPSQLDIPGTDIAIADIETLLIDEAEQLQQEASLIEMESAPLEPVTLSIVEQDPVIAEPLPPEPEPSNEAPNVSFTSPAVNQLYTVGDSIYISVNAHDSDGVLQYCSLSVNGIAVGQDTSAPYEWRSETHAQLAELEAGIYTLSADCRDDDNTIGNSLRSFIVEQPPAPEPPPPVLLPPTVAFLTPADNAILHEGDSLSITLTANDSDGSITYCDLSINDNLVRRDSSAPFQYGASDPGLGNLAPGSYRLSANCADNDGLTASSELSVTVNPAPQAPIVNFVYPENNLVLQAGESLSVELSASDNDGSIQYCNLYLNGNLVRQDSSAPYHWGSDSGSLDSSLSELASGNYSLLGECTDNDNLTSTAQFTFNVSEPEPTTANVVLDWTVPTTREDGSPLATNEIESYEIYYYMTDDSGADTTTSVAASVDGNLVTSYQINSLSAGSYLFSIATVDIEGKVSTFVDPVPLTIQ